MQLIRKALLPLSVCALALSASLPAAHASQHSLVPSGTVQSGVPAPTPKTSGRFCASGYFAWSNFADMKSVLDQRYGPVNSSRVWQAPTDDDVWEMYCIATDGKAYTVDDQVYPRDVRLSDGTYVGFRLSSLSGGYTIDINPNNGYTYKVHVAR